MKARKVSRLLDYYKWCASFDRCSFDLLSGTFERCLACWGMISHFLLSDQETTFVNIYSFFGDLDESKTQCYFFVKSRNQDEKLQKKVKRRQFLQPNKPYFVFDTFVHGCLLLRITRQLSFPIIGILKNWIVSYSAELFVVVKPSRFLSHQTVLLPPLPFPSLCYCQFQNLSKIYLNAYLGQTIPWLWNCHLYAAEDW